MRLPITSPLGSSGPKTCGPSSAMPETSKAACDHLPVAIDTSPALLEYCFAFAASSRMRSAGNARTGR